MQRIFLPRQIGSSLKFQAKAPKTAKAVPAPAADVEANNKKPAAAEVCSATSAAAGFSLVASTSAACPLESLP